MRTVSRQIYHIPSPEGGQASNQLSLVMLKGLKFPDIKTKCKPALLLHVYPESCARDDLKEAFA